VDSIPHGMVCNLCKESKPESEFYASKDTRSGRVQPCKSCTIARSNAWRAANRERLLATKGAYYQAHRDQDRAYRKANADRLREYSRVYSKKYQQTEKGRANNQARVARRKLRRSGNPDLPYLWTELCFHFGNVCLCCGNDGPLSVDHVIPLALGGLDHITNLQPLCLPCNIQKNTSIRDYRNPTMLADFLRTLQA
jgi:5-methylcytosine-specific restriction endonuclease McrA